MSMYTLSQKMAEHEDNEMGEYQRKKDKMDAYIDEFDKHQSPKIKRRQDQIKKDYGQQVPDKLERLKDENLNLKRHQGDLETDVKVISTQLKRMIEQLKSDKIIVGKAAHFEKTLDSLIEEQVTLQEQGLGLMKKVKSAQTKGVSRGQENKKTMQPSFSGKSLSKGRNTSASRTTKEVRGVSGLTLDQEDQLRILKESLFNSVRQVTTLRKGIEDMKNTQMSNANSAYLFEAKRKLDINLIESRQELSTVESDYHVKKDIFSRNEDYRLSLLDQYNDMSKKRVELDRIQRETVSAGNEMDSIKSDIEEAKNERNQLQREFDNIMKQPFFRKEHDANNLSKINSLKAKIDQYELEVKKSRANITKHCDDIKEVMDENKGLMKDKQFYTEQLRKINTYNDPSGLTVEQIQAKLEVEDPSMFR